MAFCYPQRIGGEINRRSTLNGILFETEGLGGVASGLEERFKMGGAEDLCEPGLVLGDPVCGGQGPGGFVQAFACDVFFSYDYDHSGEKTLENVEDIANGSAVAERGECRAVKYHLPLDSTLGGKERSGVDWDLYAHRGGTRETVGGFVRTGAFDGKEHARVCGGNVVPTVFLDEVGLESEQPPVSTSVGGTESVGGCERDTGSGSPVVHSLYATGKRDDGEGGVGHWRWGTEESEERGGERVRGEYLRDEREAPSS